MSIEILTAGESHGPGLTGIIAGLPAGLEISVDEIDAKLNKRQYGLGRSSRQQIENDMVRILSGIRHGKTIGSPISILIENKDYENWLEIMSPEKNLDSANDQKKRTPRPGHADIAGALKYGFSDSRNVLERASGRTTAMTVAIGSICGQYLAHFGIFVGSRILRYGPVRITEGDVYPPTRKDIGNDAKNWLCEWGEISDEKISEMKNAVADAKERGDTFGGVVQVAAAQMIPGLGSCALPSLRLDSRITSGFMSVPAIKAVELGAGIFQAGSTGRESHDKYLRSVDNNCEPWYSRVTNFAGGIEGGISNGEPICVTAWMKPLSSVNPPLGSIDLETGMPFIPDATERSDIAAVESAASVLEAVMAIELTRVHREKFGGDSMKEVMGSYERYIESLVR